MRFWLFLGTVLIVYHHFSSGKVVGKSSKTDCYKQKDADISPKNVYIVIISNMAVDKDTSAYHRYYNSVAFYSEKHGYNLELVNINETATDVSKTGKKLYHQNNTAGMIKYNKPMVMLNTLQRLYEGSSCEQKYVVYLDIDVYIVDFNYKIEDIIHNANIDSTGECHLLAQDAPTTINTGVLIFKVSSFSIDFIRKWIKLQQWHTVYEKIKWQDEQGWLQYTYLIYIASHTKQKLPLDCTWELKGPYEIEANIRNKCYAYNLYHLGILPGNRNVGNICLLSGMSSASRINLHDWEGVSSYNERHYTFQTSLYTPHKSLRKSPMQPGSCKVDGGWVYHGKDSGLIAALSKGVSVERFREQSIVQGVNCTEELLHNFNFFIKNTEWIPHEWLRQRDWITRK